MPPDKLARLERLIIDPALYRHSKKKNLEVAKTSLETFRDLEESGWIKFNRERAFWWLNLYMAEKEAGDVTAPELKKFCEEKEFVEVSEGSSAQSFVQRPLSKLRDAGFVWNPPDRDCTVLTHKKGPKKGEFKNLMVYALVKEGDPVVPKKQLMPKKDLFPKILRTMTMGLLLTIRAEISDGKTMDEAFAAHEDTLQVMKYLHYHTILLGWGLPKLPEKGAE